MPDYRALLSDMGIFDAPVADWQDYLDEGLLAKTTTPWGSTVYTPGAKLPGTKYGSPLDVRAYDEPSGQAAGGFKLRNTNLKYNDPNYGWITPGANTIDPSLQRNWMDYLGPAVMALVTAGAGALPAFGETAALAGGLGAGAAGEVSGGLAIGAGYQTSIPWYVKAGLETAKIAGADAPSIPGVSPQVAQSVAAVNAAKAMPQPVPAPVATGDFGYDPAAYGNMGSMANLSDGSQMVSTSVAPNAYDNSYTTQTQVIS